MILLLQSVLLELLLHRVRAQALCHEIVTLVAQDAYDLRRKRVVQHLDDGIAIGAITRRHRALLDVRARALAEGGDIGEMRTGVGMGRGTGSLGTRIGHGSFPSLFQRRATMRATMAPTAAATRTAFNGSRRTYSSVAPRVRTARSPAASLSAPNLTRASASLRVSSARATAAPSLDSTCAFLSSVSKSEISWRKSRVSRSTSGDIADGSGGTPAGDGKGSALACIPAV